MHSTKRRKSMCGARREFPSRSTTTHTPDQMKSKLSQYDLGKEVARGGEGVVFMGSLKKTGEQVAIKRRHCNDLPDANEALQEALMLARVSCDFVVGYRDVFMEADVQEGKTMFQVYIIQEFCAGGDLFSQMLQVARDPRSHKRTARAAGRHRRMPLSAWCQQLCIALATLHEAGVIHRDVKIENVILRTNGSVCLADFGCSVAYNARGQNMSGARADDTAGSTTYCAPELLVGRGVSATVDTDLWALGCVILEICSGHLFQTRKDRLVLGRVALEDGQDGKQSWKTVRDKLLSDMVSKTNKLKPLVLGLLSIEPEKRTNLVHFLETEPDAFLEPVKKKDAAADAKAGAAGAPNGKAGDDAAREKGGSDSAEEQAVRTKTGGGAGKLKAAVAGGTPSREPSIAKGVEAGGADSAAASNDLSDDSEMNPINWGKEQFRGWLREKPYYNDDLVELLEGLSATDGASMLALRSKHFKRLDADDAALLKKIKAELEQHAKVAPLAATAAAAATVATDDTSTPKRRRRKAKNVLADATKQATSMASAAAATFNFLDAASDEEIKSADSGEGKANGGGSTALDDDEDDEFLSSELPSDDLTGEMSESTAKRTRRRLKKRKKRKAMAAQAAAMAANGDAMDSASGEVSEETLDEAALAEFLKAQKDEQEDAAQANGMPVDDAAQRSSDGEEPTAADDTPADAPAQQAGEDGVDEAQESITQEIGDDVAASDSLAAAAPGDADDAVATDDADGADAEGSAGKNNEASEGNADADASADDAAAPPAAEAAGDDAAHSDGGQPDDAAEPDIGAPEEDDAKDDADGDGVSAAAPPADDDQSAPAASRAVRVVYGYGESEEFDDIDSLADLLAAVRERLQGAVAEQSAVYRHGTTNIAVVDEFSFDMARKFKAHYAPPAMQSRPLELAFASTS